MNEKYLFYFFLENKNKGYKDIGFDCLKVKNILRTLKA